MVVHTRLDCVLGSTALMRRAVAEATHHAAHRAAFGRLLIEQPLMQNVLADLCLDVRGGDRDGAAPRARLRRGRPRVPAPRDRGGEVLGLQGDAAARRRGAGVPRRQRLRRGVGPAAALPREPGQLDLGGLGERQLPRRPPRARARAGEPRGVPCRARARPGRRTATSTPRSAGSTRELADTEEAELRARRLVERLALCLQGSLLVRHAPPAVADAFCATRLGGEGGRAYGTLPPGVDTAAIVERHRPRLG